MGNWKKNVMIGTSFETLGGISSVVKVYRDAGLLQRLQVRYLETHRDGGRWRKISYFARAWLQFLGLLLTAQIAILHVHLSVGASFWRKMMFVLPSYLFNIPVIVHLHGGGFAAFYGEQSGPRVQRLIRYVYDRAACVIVLSQSWKTWVQSISKNPYVEAIYNPVHVPAMIPFAAREQATVLFLGKIGRTKGCWDLLEACGRLQHKHPQMQVCFAGNGDAEHARELGDKLGLKERLELPGWTVGAQKQQLLARAAIFALPSYWEGLPMGVLEAMAAGMPILATPVGGIPEAVQDGVDGFLVKMQDVDALTAALDRLLGDAVLREKMGAAARAKVEATFSTACICPQVERIYQNLGYKS